MDKYSIEIYSVNDLLETYRRYKADHTDQACELILSFIAELTGMNPDKIIEMV